MRLLVVDKIFSSFADEWMHRHQKKMEMLVNASQKGESSLWCIMCNGHFIWRVCLLMNIQWAEVEWSVKREKEIAKWLYYRYSIL